MTLTQDDIRFLTAARQFLDRTQIAGNEARVWVAVADWLETAAATLGKTAGASVLTQTHPSA